MNKYLNKIDNDLSISRNVSSNKMIHAILALVFLTKLFLSSHFSAPMCIFIYVKTRKSLFCELHANVLKILILGAIILCNG